MRAAKNVTGSTMLGRMAAKINAKEKFEAVKNEAVEKAGQVENYRRIQPFMREAERARLSAKRKVQKELDGMAWPSLWYVKRTMPLVCALKVIDIYHSYFLALAARDEGNRKRLKDLLREKERLAQVLDRPD